MRRQRAAVLLLLILGGAAGAYWVAHQPDPAPSPADEHAFNPACFPDLGPDGRPSILSQDSRVSVPNNRGAEIPDGFRGEVHPLLSRSANTIVTAYWEPPGNDFILPPQTPPSIRKLYREVQPAVKTKEYTERDFAVFAPPPGIVTTGQLWALDLDRAAEFLKQFHPSVSTHVASVGRRPGPDGAFALFRGISPTHLEIAFRMHAEFDLLPKSHEPEEVAAWYSPACFTGRMIINRQTLTVEYFQFGVPVDSNTNLHTTSWAYNVHAHSTHRLNRMELVGGNPAAAKDARWTDQMDWAAANEQLAAVFYKFKEIHFRPFDKTLELSKTEKKPIIAFVLLGALDDQSC